MQNYPFWLSKVLKRAYIIIIAIAITAAVSSNHWVNRKFIAADGLGYYAYLPAVFIYHDLQYNFINIYTAKYYHEGAEDFRRKAEGKVVNITFIGLAILWIPFFLAAHLISFLLGMPTDGYGLIYQLSIPFAAFIYLAIGLRALGRYLRIFNLSEGIIAFTLLIIVFATPIFYYTSIEACFTHVYSFSLISVSLLYASRYLETLKLKHLIISVISLALIALIRPINGIVILIVPLLAGNWRNFKQLFIRFYIEKKVQMLLAASLFLAILFIQPLFYYLQTGHWMVWSYKTEQNVEVGFNFLKPEIVKILFSYLNGFFLYTPIALLSLIGFVPLWKINRFQSVYLAIFLMLVIYIMSSWWCWWFGCSFGNRAFVDYLPFYAILLGFALSYKKMIIKVTVTLISILFLFINLIQTYQYKNYIFYHTMDKQMYWDVFLKTGNEYKGILYNKAMLKRNWALRNEITQGLNSYNTKMNIDSRLKGTQNFTLFASNQWGKEISIDLDYYKSSLDTVWFVYLVRFHVHRPIDKAVFYLVSQGVDSTGLERSNKYLSNQSMKIKADKEDSIVLIDYHCSFKNIYKKTAFNICYQGNDSLWVDESKVEIYKKPTKQ